MSSLSSWPTTHPSVYSQHLARSVQEMWGQKVRAYTFFAITMNDFNFLRAVALREKESGSPCQATSLIHSHGDEGPEKFLMALCQSGQGGPTVE